MRKIFAIGLIFLTSAGAALAQSVTIPFPDQQKRVPPPPPPPKLETGAQAQPKTPPGRIKFAERLSASFTANGHAMRVLSQESGDGAPKLMIQGAFDDPFIYRMISTGNFLGPAAQSGFRSVELVSIINQRRTVFDLSSGRAPKCDVTGRICI